MRFFFACFPLLAALLAGCATEPKQEPVSAGEVETCHVCHYNNDLACIRVGVRDTTPRTEYEGKTYFFCSEECRAAFLKKPAKYLPR